MTQKALFQFAEESMTPITQSDAQPWWILIVDDDEDVHTSTVFSMKGVSILNRPLAFLHAYSAREALELLQEHTPAVILLDVVMETDRAGLELVKMVRGELRLQTPRIILRTGQPGYAPELETIERYDINDYKLKSELTRERLFAAITAAIRNYRQLDELEQNRQAMAKMVAISSHLFQQQELQSFAYDVIHQLEQFVGVRLNDALCIQEQTEAGGKHYRLLAGQGPLKHFAFDVLPDKIKQQVVSCFRKGDVIDDTQVLILPVNTGYKNRYVLYLSSQQELPKLEPSLVQLLCRSLALSARNVGLLDKLRKTAYEDSITGLANRNSAFQFLQQVSEQQQPYSLMLLDIDQFSMSVDTFGFRYCNDVLLAFARRLEQQVAMLLDRTPKVSGQEVCIARLNADVFALVYPRELPLPEHIDAWFRQPLVVSGNDHALTICSGIVQQASHGQAEDRFTECYLALKEAKKTGVAQQVYFQSSTLNEAREHAQLLQLLKHDFEQGRLFLVYQPQVELNTGQVVGVEALLRWRTEQGVMISPDRFIALAEQSGMIVPIGSWVLQQALACGLRLHQQGFRIKMAVNISVVQLQQSSFVPDALAGISDSGFDPRALDFEITESVAVLGANSLNQKLQGLHAAGIDISIDDFGTGFSSLSYLDRLSANCLKIDRCFVQKLDESVHGTRIAEMIVALGRQLDLKVLAEGIETQGHLDLLKQMGCNEGQGYFFARPMEEVQLYEWLQCHPAGCRQ